MTILYIVLGIIGVLVAGVFSYNLLFGSSPIIVEDFSNKTVAEIDIWAKENDITVEYNYVYDDVVENGLVIAQSVEKETEIKKGSTITITLSQGADPSLEITLPDFTGYNYNQIAAYAAEFNLTDVTYDYVENADIATDIFISHNITTPTMKRSDMIIFTMSLGQSEETTEITVPDFSSYTKTQINNWATANNVIIKYITATSTTIDTGNFIKQSPASGAITYARRTITITYSSGKPIEAIDLSGKTKTQVISWLDGNDNRVYAKYSETYNNDVAKNTVISNSPSSGYLADGATITVYMSLGKPNVTNFVGDDYSDLTSQVTTLNNSGASLTVSSTTAYSDTIDKGKVISQDKSGEMSTGSKITVVYSKGKQITMSNYVGKTLSEFSTYCSDNGLNKTKTSEKYSDTIAANSLISHSPASGALIDEGSTVSYVLSLGLYSPTESSFLGKTYADASSIVSAAVSNGATGWNIVRAEDAYNSSYAKDIICNASISGKVITVTVSKGTSVTIEDYFGRNIGELPSSTTNLIIVKVAGDYDANPYGYITGQSIAAGVYSAPKTLTITYSKGTVPTANVPAYMMAYNQPLTASEINTAIQNIKTELAGLRFTNVTVGTGNNYQTPGTIFVQNHVGETALNAEIIITFQN